MALLELHQLSISVPYRGERFLAVRDIAFILNEGDSLGIVGESGSGKSLTAHAIAGLNAPQVRVESGSIRYDGQELRGYTMEQMQVLRGREIAMIFQNATGALNPLMRVGQQVGEGLLRIDKFAPQQVQNSVEELFRSVELPDDAIAKYPHQLSGGQRQRVMIALALARRPRLLIADEPTTALDLTTQRGLLRLLRKLHAQQHMALLLISHDVSVVQALAENLLVLYAGEMLEIGPTSAILARPRHPYTQGLLGALPSYLRREQRLVTLRGVTEALDERPAVGCVFAPRCLYATEACQGTIPMQHSPDGVAYKCIHV